MSSITCLPDELLGWIFNFLHDKTAAPTVESQKEFALLARTSKLFLPVARSRLYYRPIPPIWPSAKWKQALSLVSSLSTALGRLVISLEGLVNFAWKIGNLEESPNSLPFLVPGYTKTFSLFHKIISSCPRLTFAEISCDSKKSLTKVLEALKNSIPTLKTVKFVNSANSGGNRINVDIVSEALRRLSYANVDEIILYDVDPATLSGNPRGPLALCSFTIISPRGSLYTYAPILPENSVSVSSIGIRSCYFSNSDLTWFLEYLSPSLRHLSINATQTGNSFDGKFSHYGHGPARPTLPPSEFSHFTSLDQVSLKGFDGPSLALLDTLVSASPNISLLRFEDSLWVDPSSPLSPSYSSYLIVDDSIPSILDPNALLSHLLQLKKLRSVHLGWLPTRKRETFRKLEEEMAQKRGVKVEWQVCD
ncbi:hypothetical protein JCM5350_005531 [Sporobolomyces pararoseus]